jgi:hypothetical protein
MLNPHRCAGVGCEVSPVASVMSQHSYQTDVRLLLADIFLVFCDFVTLRTVKMSKRAADSPVGNSEKQKRKRLSLLIVQKI